MAVLFLKEPFGLYLSPMWSGPYQTPVGTLKNTGTPSNLPVRRRVRLHHQPTGAVVREAWSDAQTGAYQFSRLPAGTYYVVAFDHTLQYSGVTETDVVLPVPPTP